MLNKVIPLVAPTFGIVKPLREFDYVTIKTAKWYKAKNKYVCSKHGIDDDPRCSTCWDAFNKTVGTYEKS